MSTKPPVLPPASRLGLLLFGIYLVLYGGFIYLCAFQLEWMKKPGLGGVNHATWYGFTLIVAAFVMALLYMMLAGQREDSAP